MVSAEAALKVRVLHRHGKGVREIARDTGLSRNTVRRYLRDAAAIRYKARPPRATKLDPFKGYVVRRLAATAPDRNPATVLVGELRDRGYAGGITMLKVFMASLGPAPVATPAIRFETTPGEQMQVDWAVIHAILNNYAAHKHPEVLAWLADHPRWTFHFTPTSCSWLNAAREDNHPLHRRNEQEPKPFVWTANAKAIRTKLALNHPFVSMH